MGIGVTELLIVLAIVVVLFGAKRLPLLGRQLGGGLREFKDSVAARADRDEAEDQAQLPAPEAPPASVTEQPAESPAEPPRA
jgi:sec-independent protein translocase protein TatA